MVIALLLHGARHTTHRHWSVMRHLKHNALSGAEVSSCTLESGLWLSRAERGRGELLHVRVLVGVRRLSRSTYPSDDKHLRTRSRGELLHVVPGQDFEGTELGSCILSHCLFLRDVVFVACLGLDLRGWGPGVGDLDENDVHKFLKDVVDKRHQTKLPILRASCSGELIRKQENSLKASSIEHSPKWLQADIDRASGTHPGAPLEEDADETKIQAIAADDENVDAESSKKKPIDHHRYAMVAVLLTMEERFSVVRRSATFHSKQRGEALQRPWSYTEEEIDWSEMVRQKR
ncbi:hypothetical protein F2Q68_00032977 [Brassica cretica]|uniref:Uncharacterized protein n=1 Tax=Brassica cretica TaxID=69181 RepID=A0A8S9G7P0_BRACR|nr:hypothetical protein F2Q68_00032977 [Brassica cretica]